MSAALKQASKHKPAHHVPSQGPGSTSKHRGQRPGRESASKTVSSLSPEPLTHPTGVPLPPLQGPPPTALHFPVGAASTQPPLVRG